MPDPTPNHQKKDSPKKPTIIVDPNGMTVAAKVDDDASANARLSVHDAVRDAPILENFVIESELGRGGMSVVYKATQRSPRRSVALKVLRVAEAAGEKELLRFQREAAVVALLTHPYIVPIFELGKTENDELFYTMPMVQGLPLDEHVSIKKLSVRETVKLFVAVCEGVEAAHRTGAIHRDI